MDNSDIRWQQRLANYNKALAHLTKAIELSNERPLSDLEEQGLIQAFEFTHELAWNVIRDYFIYQGNNLITGSRDATREAFNKGLIEDGAGWMEMIKSRNQTSHTYNEETANEIVDLIRRIYFNLFKSFEAKMQNLLESNPNEFSK
jgi:nucleotidyltransferase substrate binding protein (TIGR01987 family)